MSRVSQGVLSRLREELYGRLLVLPPQWFEQRHSGELLSRFTSDVAQLEFAAGQALASLTKDSLQVVGLLVVCLVTDWRLFLVIFIVLPGTIIPVSRFARGAKQGRPPGRRPRWGSCRCWPPSSCTTCRWCRATGPRRARWSASTPSRIATWQ